MKFKKSITIFLIIIAAGAGLFIFINRGYYPVAKVNYNFVSADTFNKDYAATLNYLQIAYASTNSDVKELEKEEVKKEIKRALLNKLIENSLIYEQAQEIIGKELPALIDKKIKGLADETDFKKNIENLYGMSFDDIVNNVLEPQACREIVESRLILDGKDFNSWLSEIKKQAKVSILMKGFVWENGEIISK